MKRLFLSLTVVCLAVLAGWFLRGVWHPESGIRNPSQASTSGAPLFYQSPMHPWIKSDKPGKCTICGMDLAPVFGADKGLDSGAGQGLVTLGTNSVQAIHVATSEAARRPLTHTLRFAGTIDDDDTRHRILSAYVDARIERLHVNYQGAEVTEGQPLATIYSPMLLNAAREFLTFRRSMLSPADAATGHGMDAATARLRALGLSALQVAQLPNTFSETNLLFEILAPMTGTVVARNVYEGQSVKEGEKMFELADFTTMWLKLEAYERDLGWLRQGQVVEVTSAALPGRTLSGRVAFIDPNFDEKTRSTKVRVEIPNPLIETGGVRRREISHRLLADARVTSVAPEVLAIPRSSVLNAGGAPIVYVEKGPAAYEQRRVTLGRSGDDLVEVLAGVSAGERVVTRGNLLIDAQAQLNSGAGTPEKTKPSVPSASLNAEQTSALQGVFAAADNLARALAADDLTAFQAHSAALHTVVPAAADVLKTIPSLAAHIDAANRAAHWSPPSDIATARARFHAFVTPVVELAKLTRSTGGTSAPRIFQCPMTKKSFPTAPANAFWLQLGEGTIRNPYFGAEMLDCGTEVKP